jgi:O-succinylbenzoate synthase
MTSPPPLDELRDVARVVTLPLVTSFRGIAVREAMLLRGPRGWTEFSPFLEYGDAEAAPWLAAAVAFGWDDAPPALRDSIPVNATLPAVGPDRVEELLERFGQVRTVKVKVAEAGRPLEHDVARLRAVRAFLGSEGRIRVDANGAWGVDDAERAATAFAPFDIEYLEQPCASVTELAALRARLRGHGPLIAADESVRKAADPLEVARAEAADLLVVKAQPLGGVAAALRIVAEAGLPVVVSSALETSVGLAIGARLAAVLPELDHDCGLGTAALFQEDITTEPLLPRDGHVPVRRVEPDPALLERHRATAQREAWWHARLGRVHAVLASPAAE